MWFIPTCAGFTNGSSMTGIPTTVHPHIRGVYASKVQQNVVHRRFIPTCVGFTWTMRRTFSITPVHPHVRGVYGHLCLPGHQRLRSIPTYVGFTSSTPGPSGTPSVHPHVREVYVMDNVYLDTYYGPSPRAWGLHARGIFDGPDVRSIPTCVGFTQSRPFR